MTLLEALAVFDRVVPVERVAQPDEEAWQDSRLFCCGQDVELEFTKDGRRLYCAVCGKSVACRTGKWELERKGQGESMLNSEGRE